MRTFYISDTHFGHAKCWEVFTDSNGDPMRPFSSTEEMDQTMADRWNEVVGPEDRVFHLGDVVINKKFIPILDKLNGKKHLIIGNHDIHHLDKLAPYFESMTAMRIIKGIVFTHFPIHPSQLNRFGTNVHGHLHSERVPQYGQNDLIDPRYHSVCVEHTDYRPVEIGELRARISAEQAKYGVVATEGWGNGSGPG